VKWLLALPHYVVLAFLWPAFGIVTLIVMVAIVATGRYPRAVRLQRRRAALDVACRLLRLLGAGHGPLSALHARAGRLSGGARDRLPRAVVALEGRPEAVAAGDPHYAALAALLGGWHRTLPGLLGVLAVAAVLLLVRGRYPRDVFSLVVGINRWALRVAAYAGLMRDEYPPFRLDR
jgi:hypothetical protein